MRKYIGPLIFVILALVLLFGGAIVGFYTDWLWFADLGYSVVFIKSLLTKVGIGAAMGLLFFAIIYGNLWYARRIAPPPSPMGLEQQLVQRLGSLARRGIGLVIFLGSIVVSVMVGLEAATHWEEWLLYSNATAFGVADPLFHRDIAFYVFQLPFIEYVYGWLFFALAVATIATVAIHYADEAVEVFGNRLQFAPRVKSHVGVLIAAMFFLKAWGYRLAMYGLLYGPGEQFDGAGYTDVHARVPAYWILLVIAVIGGLLVLMNIFRRGITFAAAGLVGLVVASVLVGGVYPYMVQQYEVTPNQLEKELPYIKLAIDATQQAFGLTKVNSKPFAAESSLTVAQLEANSPTIENIRLWDQNHLQDVYLQKQTLQPYYHFQDVDVDRYWLSENGGQPRYRQVWLSARELQQSSLPPNSQTWVNQHLQYTHGYGFCMSPVNAVTAEGLPTYFVYDIPPKETVDLAIKKPEVYFGELTDQYVFADTSASEFNYPSGSQTVQTSYKGNGGVGIGNFFRRLMYAVRFQDINILLNQNLRPNSRVLYDREIRGRISTLLPFLQFDGDPYLVIANGGMYWMQDAYTSATRYPYAQHYGDAGINYIRNSVKVVVDAYTGRVDAYMTETPLPDPIIKTYAKIYPGIFKPIAKMPAELRDHIRYPEGMFQAQMDVYRRYHMSDPRVFYNQSDLWEIPNKAELVSSGQAAGKMEPYYVIMKLPNGESEEFILMTPYTRAGKSNMVAWLAAKCDGANYGTLVLYQFPKDKNVYGPEQIAGLVGQNTDISQQLTLWSQQGSQVSSGNLLVVPIENSLLYVMPLYLQSTGTKIPQLQRVIVALGDKISMQTTLAAALSDVVGGQVTTAPPSGQPVITAQPTQPTAPGAALSPAASKLVNQAVTQYNAAQAAQRAGNWAEYGKQINALKATLDQLRGQTGKQ